MTYKTINQAGLDLIKSFEGYRDRAYQCSAGVWTIGYGHTQGVRPGDTCTQAEAETWLRKDVADAERAVNDHVNVPITSNEFSALVSFVFNVGAGAFRTSTLLRRLNAGAYGEVPYQLTRWNKAGGHVLAGLVRRRAAEAALWTTPDDQVTA